MRTEQVTTPLSQMLPQPIRVTNLVIDEPCGVLAGTPATAAGYGDGFQRQLDMPSKHRRLGIGLGPPPGGGLGFGEPGSCFSRYVSINSDVALALCFLQVTANYTL